MKDAVIKYIADDNSEWTSPDQALARDALLARVAALMAPLGEAPRLRDQEYYPHGADVVRSVRVGLLRLCRDLGFWRDSSWWQQAIDGVETDRAHPHSIVGRIIDDTAPAPVQRAWRRLMQIDGAGREWQQPYFVSHPPAAPTPVGGPHGTE